MLTLIGSKSLNEPEQQPWRTMSNKFDFPQPHNITIDVDGERHSGDWCIMLNDLVVYFQGFALSCPVPTTDRESVAKEMLKTLVLEHYVPRELLATVVPQHLLDPAHKYLNTFDDDEPLKELIAAMGPFTVGSTGYLQVARMAVDATGLVVPYWKMLCDDDAPAQIYARLRSWLQDSSISIDWQASRQPCVARSDGHIIEDTDSCRLEPIATAVASLASYLQSANPRDAVRCLQSVSEAYSEGCHSAGAPDSFEKWLVIAALPRALQPAGASPG